MILSVSSSNIQQLEVQMIFTIYTNQLPTVEAYEDLLSAFEQDMFLLSIGYFRSRSRTEL